MFEWLLWLGFVGAVLIVVAYLDQRANRPRPMPKWDGTDQAHPVSVAAVASRQVREFGRQVERMTEDIKRTLRDTERDD